MNKPSANKLYKESNSELPFKEWLISQQKDGTLENHFNASGVGKPKVTLKASKAKMFKWGVVGVVAVGVLVYGIYQVSKRMGNESNE